MWAAVYTRHWSTQWCGREGRSTATKQPAVSPACCLLCPVSCCRVLFLRRRLVRSRYKPVCRTLGAVVVPGDPLYQLVVLLCSSILTLCLDFSGGQPRVDVSGDRPLSRLQATGCERFHMLLEFHYLCPWSHLVAILAKSAKQVA